MLRAFLISASVIAANFVAVSTSHAGPVVPEGLQPGDSYQLVFVTAGTHQATSTDVETYNDFVNQQAALAAALTGTDVGVEWFAVASTGTVDARDNAVVGADVPVYLLNGTTKVADGYNDFWDGSLDAAINLTQNLTTTGVFSRVWSGTNADGTASLHPLGNVPKADTGLSSVSYSSWIHDGFWYTTSESKAFYALSETLTVPDPDESVPEPGSAAMLLIGCGCLAYARRRRRRGTTNRA